MTKVVGVRFRQVGKIYFFAPGQYNVEVGQHVMMKGKLRTGKRKKKRIRYVLRRLRSIILK